MLQTLTPKNGEKMKTHEFKVKFGERDLIISFGQMANLATGSVTVRYGDTMVLATAVVANEARDGVDFFPLLIDYEERLYAAGKISGSRFIKREGRPSEEAILTCRLIDRPIRPLFPKNYRKDVQVIITTLAYDGENDPDILGMIGASAALSMTKAPFLGPLAGARVGYIKNKDGKFEFVVNPTKSQLKNSTLDLTIAGTKEKIMMIEAGAQEIDEDTMLKAMEFAQKEIQPIIKLQNDITKEMKASKEEITEEESAEIKAYEEVKKYLGDQLKPLAKITDKDKRTIQLNEFETKVLENFDGNYKQVDLKNALDKIFQKEVREAILIDNHRPDGRALTEIRPIDIQISLLPRIHGSALFTRGQTQALSIVTLGSPGEEQVIETMTEEGEKRYMHHYNFPPFSTGEVRPMRGVSRREIGHGNLAEKAIIPVLPTKEKFPYTIRVVSEILASNGSSSMASTCGSTLALMDAGVPIKKPVAGISIGLVTADDNKSYKLLTDIQGLEDFGGDMDFKVTGTKDGITAIQMDTKIHGLSFEIIKDTLKNAKIGRLEILDKIKAVISEPRKELSSYAPRILSTKIDPSKIGELIGPGGKTINKIIEDCGGKEITSIDIDEDGTVYVSSTQADMGEKAIETVKGITKEVQAGEIFSGTVKTIQKNRTTGTEIGAIVQLTPNIDGMVHISQICDRRIAKVSDVLHIGDKIKVLVTEVDKERGRIALSAKGLNKN